MVTSLTKDCCRGGSPSRPSIDILNASGRFTKRPYGFHFEQAHHSRDDET